MVGIDKILGLTIHYNDFNTVVTAGVFADDSFAAYKPIAVQLGHPKDTETILSVCRDLSNNSYDLASQKIERVGLTLLNLEIDSKCLQNLNHYRRGIPSIIAKERALYERLCGLFTKACVEKHFPKREIKVDNANGSLKVTTMQPIWQGWKIAEPKQ